MARKLSVLLFYDCIYPLSVGGVEHRNHELAKALAARGHRVTLAGFAPGPSSPAPGVEVLPVGPPGALYDGAGRRRTSEALRLARAAARIDLAPFDVVEAANIPYVHLLPLAARCAVLRKPLVVTWYEHWGRYWKEYLGPGVWPAYAAMEWLCLHLGTRATAISRLTAERVRALGPREDVPVVPSGIPVALIRESAAAARPGPPLVYAGRLVKEKRLDLLLEAVRRLPWEEGGALLTLIGGGPDRERLEELARGEDLAGRVVFAGHLPENVDVWRRIGEARIAVQPSSREGFGLFPLEAMAAGLPVVYCESSESALAELVEPGVHGLRTPPNPAALAGALAGLLGNEGERRRLAGNAVRQAERFDWGSVAERMEAVFLEAADT